MTRRNLRKSERDEGCGVGKSESKKGRVTRDGIYERPLMVASNIALLKDELCIELMLIHRAQLMEFLFLIRYHNASTVFLIHDATLNANFHLGR